MQLLSVKNSEHIASTVHAGPCALLSNNNTAFQKKYILLEKIMSNHKGKPDKKISPKSSQKSNFEIRFLYGTT